VAALSGRPARPRLAHRFTVLGGALLAGGLASLVFADDNGGVALLVITGIVGTVLGVMLLGPPVIAALAAAGRHAPIAVRLALRDLARYQARSGAALAAVSLAVGIAATIVLATAQAAEQSAQAAPAGPNLQPNELVVHLATARGVTFGVVAEPPPAQLASLRARVRGLAAALHARAVLALDAAVSPRVADQRAQGGVPAGQSAVALVKAIPSCPAPAVEGAGQVYVATPALLARYGISRSSIRSGTQLLTSRVDLADVRLATDDGPAGCNSSSASQFVSHPVIQSAALPAETSGPNTLITGPALRALGWRSVPAGWLIQTAGPLTTAQVTAARMMAVAAGVSVETRSAQVSLTVLGAEVSAVGLLLALGVLAMTVGLIRSETAGDLRTLTAAGASANARRTLTGATAGALALLGAVLGTVVAYLALIAWHRSDLGTLSRVPVVSLLITLVGLPLIAAAAGWLLGGREPHGIARQPIE
jgi:putative ABC transport system permease protein